MTKAFPDISAYAMNSRILAINFKPPSQCPWSVIAPTAAVKTLLSASEQRYIVVDVSAGEHFHVPKTSSVRVSTQTWWTHEVSWHF